MNNIKPVKIEFGKLYNGATFYDTATLTRWVKVEEYGAVAEYDQYDGVGYFAPDEIVEV
jgi:hypothetical protein